MSLSLIPQCQFLKAGSLANTPTWQVWQDSNLQPLVLETSALPIELQTYSAQAALPGFFVHSVLLARPAIFLEFNSSRMDATVLGGCIIAPTTTLAFERYLVSWHPCLLS